MICYIGKHEHFNHIFENKIIPFLLKEVFEWHAKVFTKLFMC